MVKEFIPRRRAENASFLKRKLMNLSWKLDRPKIKVGKETE